MLRFLVPVAAAAVVCAAPAMAQPSSTLGPTPLEQNGMHTGTTATNGSSTIVTDQFGTHPDGFAGHALVNQIQGSGAPTRRHHHRHHPAAAEPSGR